MEKTGNDPRVCSCCNVGVMRIVAFSEPVKNIGELPQKMKC
jgi:hypothetical protein